MGKLRKVLFYGCLSMLAVGFMPGFGSQAQALSSEEIGVEKRFTMYIQNNTEELIARYRKHYGNVINADNARELSEDYAPDGIDSNTVKSKAGRTKWSAAVQEPASALSKEIYRRMLDNRTVIFTAGGAASGKTTGIEDIPTLRNKLASALIVYDTTLSSEESSLLKIQQAVDVGKNVYIIFVYRDPVDSLVNGALPRAMTMGRTIPLKAFAATHLGAPEVLASIAKKYKGDSRLEFDVVDNSLGKGKAVLVTENFKEFFQKRKEPSAQLMLKLEAALEGEHRKGAISDEVYKAFMVKDAGKP